MTISAERVSYQLMVLPFPTPGPRVRLAYRELHIAVNGTEEQKTALGVNDTSELPRPWVPETCREPELRHEVWTWLDDVVTWLNHEYAWDVAPLIPSCWPRHPHLVHEVAILADQRRRATRGITSDPLEEWHRYCLPAFLDRMRHRLRDHCTDGHKTWPARGRYTRHISDDFREDRENTYAADIDAHANLSQPHRGGSTAGCSARLSVVDTGTGEILGD